MKYKIMILLFFVFLSCDKTIIAPKLENDSPKNVNVKFTKTSMGDIKNDEIHTLQILVFLDGKLVYDRYDSLNREEVKLVPLVPQLEYNVYAIANIDEIIVQNETELASYQSYYPDGIINDVYFPMVGELKDYSINNDSENMEISLERLVSRIDFKIDKGSLDEIEILNVRLRQVPTKVLPFIPVNKAATVEDVTDNPTLDAVDVALLNNGQVVSFFMLENCFGDLLPLNSEPQNKLPSSLSFLGNEWKRCTYVEVEAKVSRGYGAIGKVFYRFYLGNDTVKNFDVVRNRAYEITLILTKDGLDRVSWKMDNAKLNFQEEPELDVELPEYLAQKGWVKYTEIMEGEDFLPTDFSLAPTSGVMKNEILEMDIIDDGINDPYLSVKACGSGEGIIYVNPGRFNEVKLPYKIKLPKYKLAKSDYFLPLDGRAEGLELVYSDDRGKPLDFDDELYSSILADIRYSVHDECGIWVEKDSVYVDSVNEYPIDEISATILAKPRSSCFSSSLDAVAYAYVESIFLDGVYKLPDMHNYSLILDDPRSTNSYPLRTSIAPENIRFFLCDSEGDELYEGNLTYDGENLVQEFYVDEDVRATGACFFMAEIYNPRVDDYYMAEDDRIYVDVYVHLAIGGKIIYNDDHAGVYIDYSNDASLYNLFNDFPGGLISTSQNGNNHILNNTEEAYSIDDYLEYDNNSWTSSLIDGYKGGYGPNFEINDLEEYKKTGKLKSANLPYTLKWNNSEYYIIHTYESFFPETNGWI